MKNKKVFTAILVVLVAVVGIFVLGNKNSVKGSWKITDAEVNFYAGEHGYKAEGFVFDFKNDTIIIKSPSGEIFDTAYYKTENDVLMVEWKRSGMSEYRKYNYEKKNNTLVLHDLEYSTDYGYITFRK